ncbi:type II secretion system protein K [Cellvibrio zantedeschiae]|uniref:Type II secretion system protein K n=1 Tax=Cellvibrio zantedeschiae TaxID=1237077 RepID=A0ABQ3BEN6_9GAMM|nr:type II secretion system minor pseudopilin GspK [Cellvibrio zantedeschiae]GGY86865.1 type II secretion system protein K [Cellvibrio zantedeschiae]
MYACSKSLKNNRERGAVLIMVLLIVALVAGLGIKFAGDYQLGLARAEARWHGAQARAYLFSGEGAAIKFLATDDAAADYREELWGQPVPIQLPDNMGDLLISLDDANAKFNLNRLAIVKADFASKAPSDASRYTNAQLMFIRLLQALPNREDPHTALVQSPEIATAILEAIVDWTDQDTDPAGSNGAENDYYLGQPDPYQAANMPFRSVEELQMIRGVTPQIMQALRPYVTVLEPSEILNINTMPELLYRCINLNTELSPLSESQAKSLIAEKPSTGFYANLSDFNTSWNKVVGAGQASADGELAVATKYFWLTTVVQIGDQRRTGRSLLLRGSPAFKVVRREEGNL